MVKDFDALINDNEKLILENNALALQLNEATEVIEAIKNGKVDAVFHGNNEPSTVLAATSDDQTYRKFIENMSEGVVTLHTDGIIMYSNSGFARMVNLPLEKVIGTNFRSFIPENYMENFEQFFNAFPENNSKVELTFPDENGVRAHFIVSLNKLQLQDFVALNLVCTDVTSQKKAEEDLRILNQNLKKAIDERSRSEKSVVLLNKELKENIKILEDANAELAAFAHIASHDLQEPLRKIITYSSLVRRDYYDSIDARGQSCLQNMENASERMRELINDILKYSGLSKDLEFRPTNLQSVVNDTLSNLEILISESKAKITRKRELPVIDGHPGQLRQLFQNLISNSLKFVATDRPPEIIITYETMKGKDLWQSDKNRLMEDFCVLSIMDNGIGFDPEYKIKIFEIFQRLHGNSTYNGTGVGLAICKKIVLHHNGFITADSKINDGSKFTIALPVSQATGQKHSLEFDYPTTDEVVTGVDNLL